MERVRKQIEEWLYLIICLFFCITNGQAQISPSSGRSAIVQSKFRVPTAVELPNSTNSESSISYFDGLGKPLQTIGYKQSPNGMDIVTKAVTYGAQGRQDRSYLPFPSENNNGAYSSLSTAEGFYSDTKPYTHVVSYDNSVLDRTREVMGAGQSWKFENKKKVITTNYPSVVKYLSVNTEGDIFFNNVFYSVNDIIGEIYTDEQDNWESIVKDNSGLTIQTQLSGADPTLYAYDYRDRLVAVIQPNGYNFGHSIIKDSEHWQKYVFAYEYNKASQVARKHVPGAGWTEIVYDRANRPVMEQNSYQKTLNKWNFTRYDAFGRVAFTGETTNTSSRTALQEAFNIHTKAYETWIGSGGWSGDSYPPMAELGNNDVKHFNFYDNYDFVTALYPSLIFQPVGAFHTVHTSAKGRTTGTVSYNSEDPAEYYMTVLYYDVHGRVIQKLKTFTADRLERTDYQYNFVGEVLQIQTEITKASQADIRIKVRNEYDHAGRIIKTFLTEGTGSEVEIIRYSYDEIGRLTQKKYMPNGFYSFGTPDYIYRPPNPQNNSEDLARKAIILEPGTSIEATYQQSYMAKIDTLTAGTLFSGLQTLDYSWHIRGGLKGINLNATENPTPDSTHGDLFSYKLDYETAGQWSGNIGKQSWNHANKENSVGIRDYTFTYDPLNRLKTAMYSGLGDENYSLSDLNYDHNGNIISLRRKGKQVGGFGDVDFLFYNYTGSRLSSVNDIATAEHQGHFVKRGTGAYSYYENGSLKSDENKEITHIIYNTYLNKPSEIRLTDGRWIKMTYDGSGSILKREFSTGQYWEYVSETIYKDGEPYSLNIPDGRAIYKNGEWVLSFFYHDHLGNTRVTFSANGNRLIKEDATDFGPWGERLTETGQLNTTENRHLYQNKESLTLFGLEDLNDFGARYVDRTLGRMWGVDNLAEKFSNHSPYNYTLNNPLNMLDPDGNSSMRIGGYWNERGYDSEAAFSHYSMGESIVGNGGGDDDKKKSSSGYNGGCGGFDQPPCSHSGMDFAQNVNQQFLVANLLETFGLISGIRAVQKGVFNIASSLKASFAAKGVTAEGAVWAQKTFSGTFSAGGKFTGQTVEGVAGALRSGTLSAADVPINVIVRNGQTFILNTRSSAALMQAGIPRSAWNIVNQTGVSSFESMLTGQLGRNGLINGTNTIRQSGTQLILSH